MINPGLNQADAAPAADTLMVAPDPGFGWTPSETGVLTSLDAAQHARRG